jgi:DNA-binding Lrp family transcriptional regulator
MTSAEQYEQALNATKRFLRYKRTAAEVSQEFNLSPFATYERLRTLEAAGKVKRLGKDDGPSGKRGPKATLWCAV